MHWRSPDYSCEFGDSWGWAGQRMAAVVLSITLVRKAKKEGSPSYLLSTFIHVEMVSM